MTMHQTENGILARERDRLRQAVEYFANIGGHWYMLPIGSPFAKERQMVATAVVHQVAKEALAAIGEPTTEELWGTCEHHAPDIEPGDCETKDCHLDPLVCEIVWGLWERGIRTGWSCQGGLEEVGPPMVGIFAKQWRKRFG
jgi:hypothetical protein